jgi:hypothetical protein
MPTTLHLSYCTTCMNRLEDLKITLPYNLNLLKNDEELCIVNYNSQDGMHQWIMKNFTKEINQGKINYFYTQDPKTFHSPKAKNIVFLQNSLR